MLQNILKRLRRAPMQALAVVLMAAVLSASLCGLVKAGQVQQEKYEEMYDSIPVYLKVTNLSATRWDDLECPRWVMDTFTGFGFGKTEVSLKDYVKEVHAKMSQSVSGAVLDGVALGGISKLVGISDIIMSQELNSSKVGIKWLEGYDESMFSLDEPVCIVSRSLLPKGWEESGEVNITLTMSYSNGFDVSKTIEYTLRVVGTHGVGTDTVFTSLETIKDVFSALGRGQTTDSITAILADNDLQEEVRQAAFVRFAEPNATGEHTSWKWAQYFWYPYALEIDNSLLKSAEMTLKTSLLMGEMCSYLLFVLSTGAGFFVGFLMIRSRRREIALMRSMGEGPGAIFAALAAEQIICLLAGTVIGGAAFLWQPAARLVIFAGLYALGLSAALTVFLSRNLMQALKEEE